MSNIDREHSPENIENESFLQRWSVSFSTRSADGREQPIEEQLAASQELGLKQFQIDFRNREQPISPQLVEFYEHHPEINISIHAKTPKINPEDLSIANAEEVQEQIQLAQTLKSRIVTIHPPKIPQQTYKSQSTARQEKIIDNYVAAIIDAITSDSNTILGIENMPNTQNALLGHTPEDLMKIITKLISGLKAKNISNAESVVGITLDLNHAAPNEATRYQEVEKWLQTFGGLIKAIHMYSPSRPDEQFGKKVETLKALLETNKLTPIVFLESKQSLDTTKTGYKIGQQKAAR